MNQVVSNAESVSSLTSTLKKMARIGFRNLRPDEVDVRPSQVKEIGGQTKADLLLYQDARCGQNILDESVGTLNWQKKYEYVGSLLFCLIGIRNPETGEWVWKSDVGSESNVEKEKGLASDCFKRACVSWGIGRELYTAPKITITCTDKDVWKKDGRDILTQTFKVGEMEVSSQKEITYLTILDKWNNVRFTWGKKREPIPSKARAQALARLAAGEDIWQKLKDTYIIDEDQMKTELSNLKTKKDE